MGKIKDDAEQLQEYIEELEKDFTRWDTLYNLGGSDPTWTDGENLNLVRTHILIDKRRIDEITKITGFGFLNDSIMARAIPEEVPREYMARADIIPVEARETLVRIRKDYQDSIPPRVATALQLFEEDIDKNNLVNIRNKDYNYFKQSIEREDNRLASEPKTDTQLSFGTVAKQNVTTNKTHNEQATQILKEKYNGVLQRLPQEWEQFLNCASHIYKHSFGNLAMIYAQFHTATMVATPETWKKVGREIAFDSSAIKSIVQKNNIISERRLYDISHTTGASVLSPDFKLSQPEQADLLKQLCDTNNLATDKLPIAIGSVVKQAIITAYPSITNEHVGLVQSSVMYIIAKQIDLSLTFNFTRINEILTDNKVTISVGEKVQRISRDLLSELEKTITKIKEEHNYGEHFRNVRNHLSSTGEREIFKPTNRDNLQTRLERNGSADIRTGLGDSATRGQLSFGQVRAESQEIYGGRTRESIVGTDDGRVVDGVVTSARSSAQRPVYRNNGQYGEKSSSPNDRRLHESGQAYELATESGGRDNSIGSLQTDISFSPKVKFTDNVEAIKLLKQLETDKRAPDKFECQVLSSYVGWGGISQAFDQNNQSWITEYTLLKTLLTDDEYVAARESTLTAFYTPPGIISAMQKAIVKLGFSGELNILEPSCGDGRFFDNLPSTVSGANLQGIELDSLTGRLAQSLHRNVKINIGGYQDVKLPDNHFDVIIGNVPFGEYKISDERHSRLIHDFFFARSIDKIKPGGVIAFITTKGTMDKKNPAFRQWLADRAELVVAVRLPNNTFKNVAGTEVTSDIIILRKRSDIVKSDDVWIHTTLENNMVINEYFADHPENMIGEMKEISSRFGKSVTLKAIDGIDTIARLNEIFGKLYKLEPINKTAAEQPLLDTIPADPNVKNYTFTLVNGNVYYRDGDEMTLCKDNKEQLTRLITLRNDLHTVIDAQLLNKPNEVLESTRINLNSSYDDYTKKHGTLSSRKTKKVFASDAEYALLLSIENVSADGVITKAKIFTEATIKPPEVFVPQSYSDLVTLSMSKLGRIDLEFMAEQFSVSVGDVKSHLCESLSGGIPDIFFDPALNRYVPADLYLSGNVKHKLAVASAADLQVNVEALKSVQPKPLTADEINIRLGSTFIDIKYYKEFMYEIAQTPQFLQEINEQSSSRISLVYNEFTSEYTIYNKGMNNNVQTNSVYGTGRKSLYEIFENSLNLQDSKVYDTVTNGDKTRQVLNGKETTLVRKKQELIRSEFKNWLFAEPQRAQDIINTYNELFNVYRTVQYDGSYLTFDGMSNEIELRKHQSDAVARCLYSGKNVLLAHEVGAGKTYTMIAAAMELKRIGIANKSLFVVPNHLIEQWGSDFMKLYPAANILVSTKKDFEPLNRKRFIARIATGEYDAIIIGHSQFERIPMSSEYLKDQLKQQLTEISTALARLDKSSSRYTVKQLEMELKKIEDRLDNLKSGVKDDVITFEETGVDNLYIDEAHGYKNCFVHTKMNNVAGVTTTNAQKSFDMLMKTKYITSQNDGRGITFATGTPISNSMTEMFVMQRYLQQDALKQSRIAYFDEWASNFGETVTALELKPEGSGYRLRTRFAKFHNLPELIGMFSQVADIKVQDDLNLPVPAIATGKPIVEMSKPSDYVQAFIKELADRADDIRNGNVEPWDDNMLKITTEGKAVAIDSRLVDPNAPIDYDSKVYRCCSNVVNLYNKHENSLQLIFLDTGLLLYPILRDELVSKGIPLEKVAFIHDSKTDNAKASLFEKCRSGEIAVLIGSTQKMGAGTNVQTRLIANHHLDCPWRPAEDGRTQW